MDPLWDAIVKTYGPLGIMLLGGGWLIQRLLAKIDVKDAQLVSQQEKSNAQIASMQEKTTDALLKNAQSNIELKNAIERAGRLPP